MDEICVVCDRNYKASAAATKKESEKPVQQEEKPAVVQQTSQEPKSIVPAKISEPVSQQNYVPPKKLESVPQYNNDLKSYAREVLQGKVKYLLGKLEDESDIGQIKKIVEAIEKCSALESNHFQ